MNVKRQLVTAALPYANGPVHIGHLAGCYLPADIYVRFLRACKEEVKFICGSDEHGVPITIRAMKEGTTPQDVVDRYHKLIGESFSGMGISFDIYSRTSSEQHRKTAQDFFRNLYDKGLFEERESEQYYDPEKDVFLADRYIVGTCPECGNTNAYGDQCEKCGTSLSPEQLINPRSALSSATPVKKLTKHWFFPLNEYEPWLKEWLVAGKKDQWKPNVYGQCKSWIDAGLHPRAMTRDSTWGVPVPVPDAEGKVLYVWFDAPIGYISATQELTPDWADYWKQDDTKLVHFIGKDNIVFHCIIFPAMLKAHGGYVLPESVPANEFLNIEGQKVSTSRNWAVWVDEYLKDFPEMQDALRYVLCANAPETKDNDFTWKEFQDRVNSELVAVFGNFVNRTMVLTHKLAKGRVAPIHGDLLDDADRGVFEAIQETKKQIETAIREYRFREGLQALMNLARTGNKYLQEKAPWSLSKTPELQAENQKAIDNCLHVCLQLSANLAIFCNPFLPFTARKLMKQFKVVERMLDWEHAGSMELLKVNYPLPEAQLLFRKIENEEITRQMEKLKEAAAQAAAATTPSTPAETPQAAPAPVVEAKAEITFEDFAKIDLRAGKILTAEKVEKADKLLKLSVDLGEAQPRTIVSGIAQHFTPEAIINRMVTVVANLAPRKMRGIESQGMILMAEDTSGKLVFVAPVSAVPGGSEVR
ncbi:MAG: methionine--tRNA ligase [Sphingobacteriales bacterium]|nr:MAG: methionine--tRNA ligase [Sphingobacteriales bacterium]